jgi:hypothetical protein
MTILQKPRTSTPVDPRGVNLLNRPTLNNGTAFTEEERSRFGLAGLLPPQVESLDQQVARAYAAYKRKDDDLERHIYLRALQDTNEVLFYRLLLDHIEEMTPMVYTPVVAQACEQFSHVYRRPRGLFVSYPLRESIPALLRSRPNSEVDVIVVTDGERILGIGDQGAVQADVPALRDHLVLRGSTPQAAAAQSEAVLGSWVDLHAQVIGYRWGLRFCACLSAAGFLVACLIGRRKEPSIFDSG